MVYKTKLLVWWLYCNKSWIIHGISPKMFHTCFRPPGFFSGLVLSLGSGWILVSSVELRDLKYYGRATWTDLGKLLDLREWAMGMPLESDLISLGGLVTAWVPNKCLLYLGIALLLSWGMQLESFSQLTPSLPDNRWSKSRAASVYQITL